MFLLAIACSHGWQLVVDSEWTGIDFTGSLAGKQDYCLEKGDNDYCYNGCALPYGPDFLLTNYWRDKGDKDFNIHYDPWFDEDPKRRSERTVAVNKRAKKTVVRLIPSQYGVCSTR